MQNRIPKGVNMISYVPLTPVYTWVMGWDESKKRRPTATELEEMCRLVKEGMAAGACGWSAQVLGPNSGQRDYDGTPMVTDLMTEEEILTFGRVLAELDDGFIQLTYGNAGEDGYRAMDPKLRVYERLAEVSRRPILYQVVEADDTEPEKHQQVLSWLEKSNRRGLRLYGQGLTVRSGLEFTLQDWNLFDESPSWREITIGSLEDRKLKMNSPDMRSRLREEWDNGARPGPNLLGSVAGLIVMATGRRELDRYVGLTVGEIAAQEGKHIIDACLDLAVADDLQTEFLGNKAIDNPGNTSEILKSPYCIPGVSDGGAHVKFSVLGNFPTETITWLARDTGMLSLEEVHYKLSYLPAFMGGIKDRGFIREGAPADIVVYDLEKLRSTPTEVVYDLPGGDWRRVQKAEGYRWIMVNGETTFEDGKETGAVPGKVLLHGRG